MSAGDISSQFALDLQGLQRLKHTASRAPGEGLKAAAEQFESVFLQMMIKSMREAIPESGLMDSQQSRFYTEMLDKQWAQHLSGQGVGLAEQLIDQLEGRGLVPKASSASENLIAGIPRGTPRLLHDGLNSGLNSGSTGKPDGDPVGTTDKATSANPTNGPVKLADELDLRPRNPAVTSPAGMDAEPVHERPDHVAQFLSKLEGPAERASRTTGVPAKLILAQAALETGWGRHEIPTASGGNSHNLFGIKAGSRWQGDTTDITTTEYRNNRPVQQVDRFRVYDSFEDAFTDYARLIGDNPRYSAVVTAVDAPSAARALQRGGYATDPAYADKLIAVMDSFETTAPIATAKADAQPMSAF
nr:flagellar assembly peptidoglycan hydrolase FlgJ [uncultured Halomonas sp.]